MCELSVPDFHFSFLLKYEEGLKSLKNLSSCILPYLLKNHNYHNFRINLKRCVAGPRCAVEAADASEACIEYEWGLVWAEI